MVLEEYVNSYGSAAKRVRRLDCLSERPPFFMAKAMTIVALFRTCTRASFSAFPSSAPFDCFNASIARSVWPMAYKRSAAIFFVILRLSRPLRLGGRDGLRSGRDLLCQGIDLQ